MKVVLTYGTYDLIHHGHIHLLRRAKELGDYLIVGLSTNEFNSSKKNKDTYFTYDNRKVCIEAIKYVDEVIMEVNWEQKIEDIKKYNVDIFAIGSDWLGHFDYLKDYCEVVYIERTPDISSSQIKSDLHERFLK